MATLKRKPKSSNSVQMPDFLKKFSKVDRRKGVIIISVVILFIATFIVARINSLYSTISTGETWTTPIPKEKTTFNMLLMGYGGPGHDGAYLTDTMMFASINTEEKRVVLVSIPRDIWVRIPTKSGDEFSRKINSVYQTGLFIENYPDVRDIYAGEQGAGNLVKQVVGTITGQPVDNYVAIDFSGFKQVVDTLGGVDINVERAFSDPLYPVDGKESDLCGLDPEDLEGFEEKENIATESPELAYPCRYEVLQFSAGPQVMDGDTALKFVRSRHSPTDGGDFNRARRQQLFLEAVRDKVLSIGFIPKILPLMNDLEENVRTDLPIELIQRFLGEATSISDYTITQVVLTTDNYLEHGISDDGQYILVPVDGSHNWETFQDDLSLYLEGETPVFPTPTPEVGKVKN